ncbi:MAG: hypothetical protein BWX80_02759 [Candidatus Hydrogenedentes bacterium ADurb.Bin101]|nr:MAG: hypothetical protein BWX80_02759 [Candidatus Hydrogenedentes bacterium ADurb.Bin101]
MNPALLPPDIQHRGKRLAQVGFGDFHPDGVDVGTDQVPVAQIDARRRHGAGHHLAGLAEVILVVGAAARAIGIDQGRLSAAPRTAAALGIVGRGRRHVAHVHQVQLGNVHAELHGGGTEQERQVGFTKLLFAFLPVVRGHLGGMLPGFQDAVQIDKLTVTLHEIGIDLGGYLPRFQQARAIKRAHFAGAGNPAQRTMVNLIAGNVAAADLLHDAVTLERQQQETDDLVYRILLQRLLRRIVQEDTFDVFAVSSRRRNKKAGPFSLSSGTGIGHH